MNRVASFSTGVLVTFLILTCFQDLNAQHRRLDFGGRTIELVSGEVTDSLAEEVIDYSDNLYRRSAYDSVIENLSALVATYNGPRLADAYMLRGKSSFMRGSYSSAYKDWLTLFDAFRSSTPVKSGSLQETISSVLDRLVENGNFSVEKCCEDVDLQVLDTFARFYEFYKYISNTSSVDRIEQILDTKYTRTMTLTSLDSDSGGGRCGYVIDVRGKEWGHGFRSVVIAKLLTEVAIDEWEYLGFLYPRLCARIGSLTYLDGRVLAFAWTRNPMSVNRQHIDLTAIEVEGKEISDYTELISKVRKAASEKSVLEYVVVSKRNGGRVPFTVRGPISWSYKDARLESGSIWDGHAWSGRISWSEGSYMGPIHVDFVLRDLLTAKHGNIEEWVGLNADKDQL